MNLILLLIQLLVTNSFFDYSIPANNGSQINLSDFSGKKVMLVNIASNSTQLAQLQELETLYQQHKDSLVVIAIPSNSFDDEPLNNAQIATHFNSLGNFSFLLAAKAEVIGSNALGVYKWMADKQKNGRASFEVGSNFQKVLVDGNGHLIGFFSVEVNPLHSIIQNAISQ